MADGKVRGRVIWFDDFKGLGFIRDDKIGDDVFVHFSKILEEEPGMYRTLKPGQEVEFTRVVVDRPDGPQAQAVDVKTVQT